MVTASQLDVRPLSPLIGAEIGGVDLSRPLGDDAVASVRAALNRYHVVFFRDQELTPDQQADFARQFGVVTEGHPIIKHIEGHPEVLAIDSQKDRASWWHTDVTFLETPPLGSILYTWRSPTSAGTPCGPACRTPTTAWPSRCARCATSWWPSTTTRGSPPTWRPWAATSGTASTGTSCTPPASGGPHPPRERTASGLFVNVQFTQTLLGLSKIESNAILDMLYHHCEKPEYTVRFRWRPGSLAFWDNRATLHYALDDYGDSPRLAHRMTFRGDRPYGPAMPPAEAGGGPGRQSRPSAWPQWAPSAIPGGQAKTALEVCSR